MAELNTLINRRRAKFSSRIGTGRDQCIYPIRPASDQRDRE